MGGGVSCNETWGGLAGGKVSNVVRKEEERSDGVYMLSCPVIILAERIISFCLRIFEYFSSSSKVQFYFSPGIISFFPRISLFFLAQFCFSPGFVLPPG